jgi:hypothetical protein
MFELIVDRLTLSLAVPSGEAGRVRAAVGRAVELVGERAPEVLGRAESWQLASVRVPPLRVDVRLLDEERMAGAIADAILEQLSLELGGRRRISKWSR